MVAKSFYQRSRIDYHEIFSPIVKLTTIRTVLSIYLAHGWSICQLDVNNVFLLNTLSEEVFVDARSTGKNVSPIFPTKDVRTGCLDTPSEAQVKKLKPAIRGCPILDVKKKTPSLCVYMHTYLDVELDEGFYRV